MMSLDEFWHFKVGRIANMKIMSNGLLNVDNSMVYCSRPISPGFLKKIIPCNSHYTNKHKNEIVNLNRN